MEKCVQLIGRACTSGPCTRFMAWRNENVKCYERCFKIFSALLFVWSLIMLATGMAFANLDWFDQQHEPIKRAQNNFRAFVVIFSLLSMLISVFGFCVARKRTLHAGCISLFGFVVFSLGLIPLFTELTTLRLLSDLEDNDFDYYCKMTPEDLENKSRFVRSFFTFAHRFDQLSEQYINEHMCTDLCPCIDAEQSLIKPGPENPLSFLFSDEFFLSGKQKYKLKKFEKSLAAASRGFQTKSGDQFNNPMIFTNNTNEGIWTFKQCLDQKNSSKEFEYMFGKIKDPEAYKTKTEVFYHPGELRAYQMLEDEFYCSGMCKKSLFFFDVNITLGPPPQTCMKRLHEYVQEKSGAFSLAIMMAGLCTVTLFVMHVGLYCRPETQDEEKYDEQIEMGHQQPDRANIYEERDKDYA